MQYDELLAEAEAKGIPVEESVLEAHDGLYYDGLIFINQNLRTRSEKTCILAEELAHYDLTVGNILDMDDTANRKQEFKARLAAYNRLIGLIGIVECHKAGCRNLYEMAEHLRVPEDFLRGALLTYKEKYGLCATVDNYIIYFEPCLAVVAEWAKTNYAPNADVE